MLECPHDGSRKQLMLSFFEEIDALLGTNFYSSHAGRGKASTDALIVALEHINRVLRIGMIVLDDIQLLARAKGSAREAMLAFLLQFGTTVRVPLMLVGTYQAKEMLTSTLQQSRRLSGNGAFEWPVPSERRRDGRLDPEWAAFLKRLFRYQIVRSPININVYLNEFSAAFFEKTHGIKDLVVKLFVLAQRRLIDRSLPADEERLTPAFIRETADIEFAQLLPAIRMLHKGGEGAAPRYEAAAVRLRDRQNRQAAVQARDTATAQGSDRRRSRAKKQAAPKDVDLSTQPAEDLRRHANRNEPAASAGYDSLKESGRVADADEFLGGASEAL